MATVSRTIPIFLQNEGEEYGMSLEIYKCIMAYKKANSMQFDNMMNGGNFTLEGNSSYALRKVVICIPDAQSTRCSFIPVAFMEFAKAVEMEPTIGVKRNPGERGPGKKDFATSRTASAISHSLTANIVKLIDESLQGTENLNNKRLIIEASIKSIEKRYEIFDEKIESENTIISSAKMYLKRLSHFGGNFIATQATIDTVLTSLSAKDCPNNAIAESLGVPRKRIAAAKVRRAEFDALLQTEIEKENEIRGGM